MANLDVKDALTKKIGPFPGFVWAGLVGGSLLLVRVMRGQTGASSNNSGGGIDISPNANTGSGDGSSGSGDGSSGSDTNSDLDYTDQLKAIQAALDQENTYLHHIQKLLKGSNNVEPPAPTPGPIPGPGSGYHHLLARLKTLIANLHTAQTNYQQANARVQNLKDKLADPHLTHAQRHDLNVKLDAAKKTRTQYSSQIDDLKKKITTIRSEITAAQGQHV